MATIKGLIDYGNGLPPLRRPAAAPAPEDVKETPMKRSAQGLRDVLFDEIEALRRNDSTPERAGAIGKLAAHIVAVTRLEMDHAVAERKIGASDQLLLGRDDAE